MVIINRCIRYHFEQDEQKLCDRRASRQSRPDPDGEWQALLNQDPHEVQVQAFLERHPHLLPGLRDLHNGPLHDVIVTKFPLGSDFRTDFTFISRHSMALQFTFVELESPSKPVFNKDASFSQDFSHARQQVADWASWASRNMATLIDMFAPMFETYNVAEDVKQVRCYLVYGRRHEVESDRKRKERWQSVGLTNDRSVSVLTYDRLRTLPGEVKDLIVCTYENRGFYVKGSVL
jgi:hypothetical protein